MRIEESLYHFALDAKLDDYKQYYFNDMMDAFIAGYNADKVQRHENIGKVMPNRRLFRFMRGGLKESLDTTVEVDQFSDIEQLLQSHCESLNMPGLYSNFSTKFNADDSERCGNEWRTTFYVMGDVLGEGRRILGFCNFPKELN